MKQIKKSIFTRVLVLVLCFVMALGVLTSCFNNTEVDNTHGNDVSSSTTTNNGTTGDSAEKDPEVDPVDPNEIFSASASIDETLIYGTLASSVVIGDITSIGAIVPADVKIENGAQSLSLSIKNVEESDESFAGCNIAQSLDVHVAGVAADNTVPMIVNLGAVLEAGLGETELKLYHMENGTSVLMTRVDSLNDFAIHNQYYYNAETGEVSIYVASFSVFTAVQTTADEWDGTSDTTWYNDNDTSFTLTTAEQFAGFRDLVDGGNTFEGKTITLGVDIDLMDKLFDPIGFGYYKDEKNTEDGDTNTVFLGTFDGGNHTIYNLYQNCWELDTPENNYATYTYSTAGAGLFASIKNATIKNLAISGAEIVFECVDMGVLVGYAQGECHFENIVITNANIANYNRYTGGLVGEVSYGAYGIDTTKGYSHTFKNITIDSSVTVSGLWGSFGCGMGGVIGGKWGDATVLMENVVSAPVMDVYNDVVSAYQWYAFRGCGMLIGHTEEPYSDGRHSGNATASFLTCENVDVYYGDWVNYNYYEFENQDNATGQRYPWVRAEAGEYCDAFSNIRYGVPTHGGVKVSDLTEEELEAVATDYTTIVFDQLYGADRGMYGTATHEGVTVHNKLTKTIYIQNNLEWTNLKLHYWFANGDDTWTTLLEDIVLTEENGAYRVDLPAYAFGFRVAADGENVTRDFYLSEVAENKTYTLDFAHAHHFDNQNKCDCGATQQFAEYEFTFGENGSAGHKDGSTSKTTYTETVDDLTLSITDGTNIYPDSYDAMGNSGLKLGTSGKTGSFNFTVPENVIKVIIYVAGYKNAEGNVTINGTSYTVETLSNNGEYTAIVIDTTTDKEVEFATVNKTEDRCMINTITFVVAKTIEVHECNQNTVIEGTDATCTENGLTEGAKCDVCGTVTKEQEVISSTGHTSVTDAAVAPQCNATGLTEGSHCDVCGEVFVAQEIIPETEEHSFVSDECEWCGVLNHEHNYISSVTAPTCTEAGYTTYTCDCGDSYTDDEVPATGHSYTDYVCTTCGDSMKKTYTFSNYDAGTQYAENEEHVLDENTIIYTTDCHFTTQLRIYSSSSNNGYAIIQSTNPIKMVGVNAGNKVDTLNIYGSNDEGATWTLAGTIEVTSTSYKDYSVELGVVYEWIKFDVEGSNQVRLASITLGTILPCGHENQTIETVAPTCTEAGYTTTTCDDCGTVLETIEGESAIGHSYNSEVTTETTCTTDGLMTYTCVNDANHNYTEVIKAPGHSYVDGTCTSCGEAKPAEPAHTCESICGECGKCTDGECAEDACADKCECDTSEPVVVATFEFGENGTASHSDGSSKTSYSETVGNYTLSLTNGTNMYTGARDAKGNSCIKLGASSKTASFSFTVSDEVSRVIIYVAGYKVKTVTVSVNGTEQAITTLSDNGEYTAIEIDTSTNKTVTFETTSTGYRAMVNTIEFYGNAQ